MARTLFDYYAPPANGYSGTLVGRAWIPGEPGGPAVVLVHDNGVYDVSRHVATTSALFDLDDPAGFVRALPAGDLPGAPDGLPANRHRGNGHKRRAAVARPARP